jgi:hypothetical protein
MSQAYANYDAVQEALMRADAAFKSAVPLTATFVRRADTKKLEPVGQVAEAIVAAINAPGGLSRSTSSAALEQFVGENAMRNADNSTSAELASGDKAIFIARRSALQLA